MPTAKVEPELAVDEVEDDEPIMALPRSPEPAPIKAGILRPREDSSQMSVVNSRISTLAEILHSPAKASRFAAAADDERDIQRQLGSLASSQTIRADELHAVRRLGEGAFATVDLCEFRGEHPRLKPREDGRPALVAVKKMKLYRLAPSSKRPHETEQVRVPDKWVTNYQAEGLLLRMLRHENVVACYGCVPVADEDGCDSFEFVIEYMPGGTLRDKIAAGRYDARQALLWLRQIAAGMAYLHGASGAQLAHRDLKPENILVGADGVAKIADFGLCKIDLAEEFGHDVSGLGKEFAKPVPEAAPAAAEPSADRVEAVPQTPVEALAGRGGEPARGVTEVGGGARGSRRSSVASSVDRGGAARLSVASSAGHAEADEGSAYKGRSKGIRRFSVGGSGSAVRASIAMATGALAPMISHVRAAAGAREMTGQTGTCKYMAPENHRRQMYSHKIDVFSFAIIAWEVLTRRRAYEGMYLLPDQIAELVAEGTLRPQIPRAWPAEVVGLVTRAWDGDPATRPEFHEVVAELDGMLAALDADREHFSALERRGGGSVARAACCMG